MNREEQKMLNEIRELQALELDILLDVSKVCRDNGIKFFLGEGTMLGAIRHKGFIPWDDDVDLIMMRDDYERFLKIAPEALGDKYEVQHSTTIKDYWSPFIKIRKIKGELKYRQRHIAHITDNNGPYIDIFPMEYVPSCKGAGISMQGFLVRYYRGMLTYKLGLRKPEGTSAKVLKFMSKFYSVDSIHKKLDKTFRKHGPEPKEYVATLSSYHPLKNQICAAKNYEEALEWDFAGHKMPVPAGYHEILTTIYGDYMTPPPADQIVIKHHFEVTEE